MDQRIIEKFYLLWDVTFKFSHKHLVGISLLLLAIHIVFKVLNNSDAYFNTLTYLPYLSLGSLAALSFRSGLFHKQANLLLWLGLISGLIIAALLPWLNQSNFFLFLEQHVWASLFSIVIYGLYLRKESNSRISKVLSRLGQISYGLNCLHAFALFVVFRIWASLNFAESSIEVLLIRPILALTLTIIFAELSYRILEKPFLNLKGKLS